MDALRNVLCAGALAACALPAWAQDIPSHPALKDRFYFAAGAFSPKTSTTAQFDSNRLGVGTDIDFEKTLGMETSKTVPTLLGRVRLGERWRIEAEYFALNRTGERQLNTQIQWGDTVYPVNANVQSSFDFFDLRVSAGYAFFKTPDKELGIGLGLHVAKYAIALTANAIGTEDEDVLAPLPVLSLYGQFALTDRWAVGGRFDWLSLTYDKYSGSLRSHGIDILYQPFKHVGIGLGYRSLFISLDAEGDRGTLKFRQSFQGPVLFLNASF